MKFLLLSGLTAVSAFPLVAAACGNTDTKPASYIKEDKRIATLVANNSLTADYVAEHTKSKALEVALVTDAGNVTDKSFNQSSWEALNKLYDQSGGKIKIRQLKPSGTDYESQYINLLSKTSATVWVLSGFKHNDPISKFLKNAETKKQMMDKKIVIVCVDFSLSSDVYPYAYSLLFKVEQSSWIVGNATANYLSQVYSSDAAKRLAVSFGGGAFGGVTDYNIGFERGLLAWNKANADKKVKTNSSSVPLNSGFEPNDSMRNVINSVIGENPSVILPVAGPATQETVGKLDQDTKYNDVKVIGVDVDQSLTYPSNSSQNGRFLTSITKNIAQAVYDVILATKLDLDTKDLSVKGANGELQGKILNKGLDSGWVGYSEPHIQNADHKRIMTAALASAKQAYESLSAEDKNNLTSLTVNGTAQENVQNALNLLAQEINK
ncbi:BMP family ABC transporter substrate-binding protein [Mycoplasma buteonis]|uniref:BMP family ABC transporter substrate-binding protein n=1 Tax=Mycoplasma buteonis TaxID=171280 RepID=UPI00146F9731|nr:BMP family ABC transporter substrate-binding protein [Mycoplasma buteonis]